MRTHNGISTEEAVPLADARVGFRCGDGKAVKEACQNWILKHSKAPPETMRSRIRAEIQANQKEGRPPGL
ncbi:MAG: hypothetical protein ACOYM3_19220 [Terrimicrobiaceae bacterium]